MYVNRFRGMSLLLLVLVSSTPWVEAWAASKDANVVISECQKRTGLSETGCISLVRKYMSVERCQSYTNLTAEQCAEKIAELKQDPTFQDSKMPASAPVSTPHPEPTVPPVATLPPTDPLVGRILDAQREKEHRFTLIQNESKALLDFLKRHGQDTRSLENALAQFEQKKQATLLAYDAYRVRVADTQAYSSEERELTHQTVLETLQAATEHYRTAVLMELRQAVAKTQ